MTMEGVTWVATLLLVLAVTSAVADLQTRLDESSNRLVITTTKGDQDVELGYIAVEGATNSRISCSDSGHHQGCSLLHNTKLYYQQEDIKVICITTRSRIEERGWTFRTCVNHLGSHIYGGLEQYNQNWPIEDNVYSDYAYVSKQQDNVGVAERYWLFSDGRYVYIPQYVPLFIEQNTNTSKDKLCFISKNDEPYPVNRSESVMEITVCQYENARVAHENAISDRLGKPAGTPDERMTTHPIWSTWARYKRDINDSTVRQFASEVVAHGFNNSQLEIDDKWESCYGSLAFDTARFPDVRALVDDLHALGFRVALWVHPFVNSDCEPSYSRALEGGWFVADAEGNTSASWWNGQGGVIDFTRGAAAGPWSCLLWELKTETGIDSFKFDAGETSWLPEDPVLRPVEMNPVQFSMDYVQNAAQFGPMVEVRVGQHSQQFPYFVRMRGKDSRWGSDNGLKSLVPTLLQMNVVGYPFVLPDTVGGNGYGSDAPTKELFIRWLQATVFMPALQFSYAPWDFDEETVELSRQLTALHARYAPTIVRLMRKAALDGSPVNPPIWWVDPTDETALTVDSEYLLGEDLLVAPVLEEGAVTRDIYLPSGNWTDEADPEHPVIAGPTWLYNYSAPLSVLPYFTRASDVPAKGGSSQLQTFIPGMASSWVTSCALWYIYSFMLQHLLT